MRRGRTYECPRCGYEKARWHIYLTGTDGSMCENCYRQHMSRLVHVEEWYLNEREQ